VLLDCLPFAAHCRTQLTNRVYLHWGPLSMRSVVGQHHDPVAPLGRGPSAYTGYSQPRVDCWDSSSHKIPHNHNHNHELVRWQVITENTNTLQIGASDADSLGQRMSPHTMTISATVHQHE
jgi:hypothetical protein